MGIREEFYESLSRDYRVDEERSFLHRYFQAHPQQQRGGRKEADPRRAAQTFLYDVRHGRKKDRSLAMLDAYCAEKGVYSLLSGGAADAMDIEEVEAFCSTLKAGKNKGLLLPLRIDPGTGVGLYLLGTAFLEPADLYQDETCCYACLWTDDLMLQENEEEGYEGHYVWTVSDKDREALQEQCGFPNLREALNWFRFLTAMGGDAYQNYTVINGIAPPNCPAALRRYFDVGEPNPKPDSLIAQGYASFQRESKAREP